MDCEVLDMNVMILWRFVTNDVLREGFTLIFRWLDGIILADLSSFFNILVFITLWYYQHHESQYNHIKKIVLDTAVHIFCGY
jgi:hypothetical protein